MLFTCDEPDFSRSTGIHHHDPEPDDNVRPDGVRRRREESCDDDRHVCSDIIARRKERGTGEATGVAPNTRQHECT